MPTCLSHTGKVTVPSLLARKHTQQRITALTAYDFTMARLVDAAGIDLILVGDSVGTVFRGHETTLPVTLEEMIYHCRCVSRGVSRALVVGDLPFLSYHISREDARRAAGAMLKEGGVAAVKLEGGVKLADTIAALVEIDIPVIGHVGLTPQSYHRMGGHRIQGREISADSQHQAGTRQRIIADALAVEDAGASAVVLEGIPADLAAEITSRISIPTIGIGAGPACDGQILVINDLLGLNPDFRAKFVKRYINGAEEITGAIRRYAGEVVRGEFPASEHFFGPVDGGFKAA